MAFYAYDDLAKLIVENKIIDDFNTKLLEGASYQLTLGDEVYVTNSESGKKEILDEKNTQVEIKPGQFALLLTNEKLNIPNNILAFIGIKFSIKVRGLINISGFHVDPGYSGKLIFAVYNAGAQSMILEKGEPIFAIWFSDLVGNPSKEFKPYNKENHEHQFLENIPARIIERLKGHLWNPIELTNRINDVESTLSNKIIELKGRKETVLWALGILVTLLVALNLKLYLDWSSYKKGYLDGMNEIRSKQRIESIIDSMQIEQSIKHHADSIVLNYCDSIKSH
jgi:dCTP deaminase